jgi:hypothetical protein
MAVSQINHRTLSPVPSSSRKMLHEAHWLRLAGPVNPGLRNLLKEAGLNADKKRNVIHVE